MGPPQKGTAPRDQIYYIWPFLRNSEFWALTYPGFHHPSGTQHPGLLLGLTLPLIIISSCPADIIGNRISEVRINSRKNFFIMVLSVQFS
jgi:hypothetical protein